MLYVYVTCHVQAGKEQEFEQIVQKMIAGTRQEPEYVHYTCGKVQGKANTYAIIEMWHSMADQQTHFARPHIQENIPLLVNTLASDLDIQFIDALA